MQTGLAEQNNMINAFIESINGRFRGECLNVHWLLSLQDAREKIEQ